MSDAHFNDISEVETPGCYLKARYVLALMTALGTLNVYSLRNGINIAIVVMAAQNSNDNFTDANASECNSISNATSQERGSAYEKGEFDWSIQQQTLLLACYYYGYCITNIPGAWLAKRFGIRLVLGSSGLLSSVLTLLVPVVARLSFVLLVCLRIAIGFFHGVTFPCSMTGWGLWAPPLERSRLVSATVSGVATGFFVVYPIVGLLVNAFGWEAAFYFAGIVGCIWSLLWLALIHDSPAVHPRISTQERDYIEMSIHGRKMPKDREPIPWLAMAKSIPVWATLASHVSENWATITISVFAPLYIARVHGFDIRSVGFLAALPFVIRFIVLVCGSCVADFILNKKWARVIVVRKAASAGSLSISCISLITMSYLGCDTWTAIALLATSAGILGLSSSGHISSFVDIAPRHSGIIYSVANTMASIVGFIAPQVAGAILVDQYSISSWREVFWLSACICAFGAIAFALFASDQVQPWARYKDEKKPHETKLLVGDDEGAL